VIIFLAFVRRLFHSVHEFFPFSRFSYNRNETAQVCLAILLILFKNQGDYGDDDKKKEKEEAIDMRIDRR